VREVPAQFFCMGGPARTPHVRSQLIVGSGDSVTVAAPEEPGRYRLFARGGARASVEVAIGSPREAKARLGESSVEPGDLRVAPGGAITVRNDTGDERHVKLEHLAYASAAATASDLATLPAFRTLFSGDLLKRETPLRVARATILFSDLTGSTALYTDVGEAAAFRLVDDHFDVLRKAVASHGGAVIKTMGDAVMAAFTDERACLAAAIECLARFEEFRGTAKHGARTSLKLGLYSGPCYVVTANGALDYFGTTVNVASRLQHVAGAGELVIETRALESLPTDAAVQKSPSAAVSVKGVPHPIDVVRLRLVR
jgi:class 3 adenylate cyclase